MSEAERHPRDVVQSLDVGDEVRVVIDERDAEYHALQYDGERAEFRGVVSELESTPTSQGATYRRDMQWSDETMGRHGDRIIADGEIAARRYTVDGEMELCVSLMQSDRSGEEYTVEEIGVVSES